MVILYAGYCMSFEAIQPHPLDMESFAAHHHTVDVLASTRDTQDGCPPSPTFYLLTVYLLAYLLTY